MTTTAKATLLSVLCNKVNSMSEEELKQCHIGEVFNEDDTDEVIGATMLIQTSSGPVTVHYIDTEEEELLMVTTPTNTGGVITSVTIKDKCRYNVDNTYNTSMIKVFDASRKLKKVLSEATKAFKS